MTPEKARQLMRAKKSGGGRVSIKLSIAARQAKADKRARAYIERWLAGETHQQIADDEGISKQNVTAAITKYRKRHPDVDIPVGPPGLWTREGMQNNEPL